MQLPCSPYREDPDPAAEYPPAPESTTADHPPALSLASYPTSYPPSSTSLSPAWSSTTTTTVASSFDCRSISASYETSNIHHATLSYLHNVI
jgi:hypothetical protein